MSLTFSGSGQPDNTAARPVAILIYCADELLSPEQIEGIRALIGPFSTSQIGCDLTAAREGELLHSVRGAVGRVWDGIVEDGE